MPISETGKHCPFEGVEGPKRCPYPRNNDLPVLAEKCGHCFETFLKRGQRRRSLGEEDGIEKILITGRHNKHCPGPYYAIEHIYLKTQKSQLVSSYCEKCHRRYHYVPEGKDD